jgi:cell volume regulation protein A
MLLLFVQQIGIGTAVGVVLGGVAVQAFRRAQLASAGLYPVASLAFVALSFGLADTLHGSGFLAVYLVGLMLGSANIPAKQTTTNFHQGLAWVAQLALFVTLGLLVFPSRLDEVAVKGTVLALALVFVARPLGAALATSPFGYSWREKVIVGWAGLRGAVPVVLATFPVIDHVAGSLEYFDIVFFAVLLSTILQGSTFEWVAGRLGLTTDEPALPKPLMEAGTIRGLGAEVLEYSIDDGDAIVGAAVRDLALPRDAVVNVIVRDRVALPPRGSTRLRAGDRLHVLVTERSAPQLRALTDRWRTGPVGPPPRPPVTVSGRAIVLTAWRWRERDGDPAQPGVMGGQPVVLQLRIRRDRPGGLWVLEDGRYAITGPVAAVGGYRDLAAWARRRMRHCDPDERGWLETVVGALAAEVKGPVSRGQA